jgi:hypothetical protein
MVATPVLVLLHVPPVVVLVSVVVAAAQTEVAPEIAASEGADITVTGNEA